MNLFTALRGLLPSFMAFLLVPLAMGALAFFIASIVREPPESQLRWGLIVAGITLVIVLATMLVRWLRKRSKDSKLADGLATGIGSPDVIARNKGELEAARKSWKDSVAKLRGTAVAGGGSRALAALPWFVIIGAPASGKSTLLRQSGIDFPVGDAAIRGLQGTRNCDWWFSSVGIFLDTAGRYISDESAAEWGQFLDLVRQHRSGSPINGVIVAIPATDLLERSFEEQDLEAKRIRARLDELIDHLGVNFPVWIVVTKVDLIGGFVEFFGQADAATRQQMMGWTLDQGEGARYAAADFERRFETMIHRLREIRPAMVANSRLRDRPAAFAFPDELAAVGDPLNQMLQRIFEPNVYQEQPLMRGVFITSATQQGTPLQRAAARVREQLGAPAVDADAQGSVIKNAYFVKDLMHERIVQDQNMTWTTLREIERGKYKRLGINLIGGSLGLLFFMTVLAFGLKASNELATVEDKVKQVGEGSGGVSGTCDALWMGALQSSADNLKNLGLSQQMSLREDLEKKQRIVYHDQLLVPLVKGFEDDIAAADVKLGLKPVAEVYAQYLDVVAILERAADHDAKIDKGELGDEEEPKEADPKAPVKPAVPPDPTKPPKGFFPRKLVASIVARNDRLVKDEIIVKRNKAKEDTRFDVLLTVIWRNKGGKEDVKAEMAAVSAAFQKKVAEYCLAAGAAVKKIESDVEGRRAYVKRRLEGFQARCDEIGKAIDGQASEMDDLREYLKTLSEAAAGENVPGAGGSSDAATAAWLGTIDASLTAVEGGNNPLIAKDQMSKLEGYEALKRFTGTGKGGGDDAESAQQSALNAVTAQLRALGTALAGGDFCRPWACEGATNMADAMRLIDKDVQQAYDKWLADVLPHLAKLWGKELKDYLADDRRPGLAVELIQPAMKRNEMFQFFLQQRLRKGAFEKLADIVVANRRSEGVFTRDSMTLDLEALLPGVEYADTEFPKHVVLAQSLRAPAAEAAQKQFAKIVAMAQDFWEARMQNLPHYIAGDPWGYIRSWTTIEGRVAKMAAEIRGAWPNWELDARLKASPSEPAARAAWGKIDGLRKKFDFFVSRFEDLGRSLLPLMAKENVVLPGQLDKLARDLGGPGGRPAWEIRGDPTGGGSGAIDNAVRTELAQAVRDAEEEFVRKIEQYFDARWDGIRREMQTAIADQDKGAITRASSNFEQFVGELQRFFGEGLSAKPGQRLRVAEGFLQARESLRNVAKFKKSVTQGFEVELVCTLVPHSKGGDDEKYPLLLIEYREDGGSEPQSHRWDPGRPNDRFRFNWRPKKGRSFEIKMVNEKGDLSKSYHKWSGDEPLIDALRDGGRGPALQWKGIGDYTDAVAKFEVTCSNQPLLDEQLDSDATDQKAVFADDCVEVTERK